MEQQSFGYWLKLKRKALDLTREELAERVGYSTATIRKIEDQERRPSAQVIERLADIFKIPQNERESFLRFARGDWQSAPTENVENTPWLGSKSQENNQRLHSKTHLATFLFTDIESSSKLWAHAPEKMKIALQRHHAILHEAISAAGGEVFQIVGDAFCAAFTTVLSAISAAIIAQQGLQGEPWDLPFPIRVRMGIHTGEAERTANDNYASGPTLNRVARILNAAHGGQVLLSLATKDLVKDSLPPNTTLRNMGEHSLKNLMYPEHLFQLTITGLPSEFPPLNTLTHRHNLPMQLTSFIAREAEITLIHRYLSKDDVRLVTLIGPPGIGKTRLSIEAARASLHDFPDGVFFVALATLNDSSLVPQTIAQALGYVQASNVSIEEQLREGIGDKRLLLVLDNCEHLIEVTASHVSALLSACSQLKILATSRESFRIPGEWLYPLPAFDIPEEPSSISLEKALDIPGLMLFGERARAVQPDFTLHAENIATVSAICAHLDGLPLAIELIAARMRLMSPAALLQRLNDPFILTADGMRPASERQKTLSNAIAWSYNLLSAEEQKLFAYLSMFSGGFTLADVESVFSQTITGTLISNLVTSLLDKSLLQRVSNVETSIEPRYTMLVTIQEFARQRLRIFGEEQQARDRHLIYFLDVARKADRQLRGPNQLDGLICLKESSDNIRAALDWAIETGQTGNALQLVRKLSWSWIIHSNHTEGRQWFHRVLEMPDVSLYPEIYAEVLAQVANHTFLQIGPRDAKPYSEQALSVARAHQDKHNTARALVMLALALTDEKNFAAAQAALEESQTLFQEVQDEWGYGMSVQISGWSASQQENWSVALVRMEESLTIFKKLGDQYFTSVVLRGIGTAQMMQGDLAQGETAMKESLVLAQKMDSKLEIAWNLSPLGEAAQRANRWTRAVQLYWASRNIMDSIGAWQELNDLKFENDLAPCRAALSEAEFAEAEAQGRLMTMEQAVAYVLENEE